MTRDYKKEYREYHSLPEQKKNRAKRNKAHRNSNCGPGQEVDHKVPLSSGGSNSPSNWRVVSKKTNRRKGTKKMSSLRRLRLAIEENGNLPRITKTSAPDGVERLPSGGLKYRGETFPGYNKPKTAPKGSKYKKRVLAKKGDKVKVVNFGARGYKHNYSAKAKKSYLARSAGIKGKDDKFSANYWSRRELWPKNQKADGSSRKRSKSASWGKYLGYGAAALGAGTLGGAVTGAMGDRGALAGAKNFLATTTGDALSGAGWGGALGSIAGLGISLASKGKIKPSNLASSAGWGGAGGAALGGFLGVGVGSTRAHGQNIWGADPRQRTNNSQYKTAEAEFDVAAYYSSLPPEQRQAMQTAAFEKMQGVIAEMNKELEPLNKELQKAYVPFQSRFKGITDKYSPRLQEALVSGFSESGASEDYLNYLKNQKVKTHYMLKGAGAYGLRKTASANDYFDTSSVECIMSSLKG